MSAKEYPQIHLSTATSIGCNVFVWIFTNQRSRNVFPSYNTFNDPIQTFNCSQIHR